MGMLDERLWDRTQFHLDLLVDDATCLATPSQFGRLAEYSTSLPSGVYPQKRWKRQTSEGNWWLGEYQAIPGDESRCMIVWRELLVVA